MLGHANRPLLTIVVPVHDMAGRLENLSEWLDSACRSGVKTILVHDLSQDSTRSEILTLIERKESYLISMREVNVQSPGQARNVGLEMIDTPWFSFADADDFVFVPNLIKLVRETIDSGNSMGLGSFLTYSLIDGKERKVEAPDGDFRAIARHITLEMGLWRFVFATDNFGKIRFSRHRSGEDFLYLNNIFNETSKLHTSRNIVYKYFHGGSQNLTSNAIAVQDMVSVLLEIEKVKPVSECSAIFKTMSLQKLSLSVIKNISPKEYVFYLNKLVVFLLANPMNLFTLIKERRLRA